MANDAPFEIARHPENSSVIVARFSGFWSASAVPQFEKRMLECLAERPGQPFSLLFEVTQMQLQPQDVAIALTKMADTMSKREPRRVAIVEGTSVLTHMQHTRGLQSTSMKAEWFNNEADALNWLNAVN